MSDDLTPIVFPRNVQFFRELFPLRVLPEGIERKGSNEGDRKKGLGGDRTKGLGRGLGGDRTKGLGRGLGGDRTKGLGRGSIFRELFPFACSPPSGVKRKIYFFKTT